MEHEEGFRYTIMKLVVEWDPDNQDHPLGWDWEGLLGSRAEALEAEEVEGAHG